MNDKSALKIELKLLYKKWPEAKNYLRMLGCKSTQAEDIFQEALLIYVRKKEDPNFVLEVEAFQYVKRVAKFLWFNEARKQRKQATFSIEGDFSESENDWLEKEHKIQHMESSLLKLGKQCQEILQLFYGKAWSMSQIAEKIGLRNEKVAKAQKYRCLQKAKELIHLQESNSFNA